MAKPKGWTKRNRAFLNVGERSCMAAVGWNVSLEYWDKDKDKGTYKAAAFGEVYMTDEAKNHYVERKAHMRALQVYRRELNKFEEAMTTALEEAEEYNAQS